MNRTPNKVMLVLLSFFALSFFALGLFLVGSLLFQQQRTPLTNIEKQLVGRWLSVALQKEEPGAGFTLSSGRTFLSNSQQFFGHWNIKNGKFNIEYTGERNWNGNSWFEKLLNGLKSQPFNSHQLEMSLGNDGRTLQLTELSEMAVSKYIRADE